VRPSILAVSALMTSSNLASALVPLCPWCAVGAAAGLSQSALNVFARPVGGAVDLEQFALNLPKARAQATLQVAERVRPGAEYQP
jgi:hypothetical protein